MTDNQIALPLSMVKSSHIYHFKTDEEKLGALHKMGIKTGDIFTRYRCKFVIATLPDGWKAERNPTNSYFTDVFDDKGQVRLDYRVGWTWSGPEDAQTTLITRFRLSSDWGYTGHRLEQACKNGKHEPVAGATLWLEDRKDSPLSLLESMQNREITNKIYKMSQAILDRFLPDNRDPSAYWGQDCSKEIAKIQYAMNRHQCLIKTKVLRKLEKLRSIGGREIAP